MFVGFSVCQRSPLEILRAGVYSLNIHSVSRQCHFHPRDSRDEHESEAPGQRAQRLCAASAGGGLGVW